MKFLKILYIFIFILTYSCTKEHDNIAISSDGVEINFNRQGKGNPTLVFVHGWCCDKSYWKYQVPYFLKHHKVITLDLAGHGESGLNRQNWTIESFGQDVASVIKKLNLEQVILIGHSMGGIVNIEAARNIPKRVIGLVGVDTYTNLGVEYTQEQIDGYITSFESDFVGTCSSFVRRMFVSNSDTILVEQIAEDMSSAPSAVGIGALKSFLEYDRLEALKEVQIPIHCINSDKYPTNIEVGQSHALSFEVKLMPGIGHFVMMEDPERFNQLLTETIKDLSL